MVYIAVCHHELLAFVYKISSIFYQHFLLIKNGNFYDVWSLNQVVLIRTVSNLFTMLSTKMSFPEYYYSLLHNIPPGVIALCSEIFALFGMFRL